MKRYLFLFPMLLLFLAGASLADTQPAFEEVDTNDDGVITQEEMSASLDDIDFEEVDLNRDGGVTQDEYMAALEKLQQD